MGNRSCGNITNKHKTTKQYKQTENNSQPPKSTINSLPNPQAAGAGRQRRVTARRQRSASPRVRLREDGPVWAVWRCHAGSWDMHGRGDTRGGDGGRTEPPFAAPSWEMLPGLRRATRCSPLSARGRAGSAQERFGTDAESSSCRGGQPALLLLQRPGISQRQARQQRRSGKLGSCVLSPECTNLAG